ncbi:hypothetical protein D1094_02295 [Colwellia sp. RSH04]|nr:hypothetical protein D1094_02295 [Colwellia sp. RSH04]
MGIVGLEFAIPPGNATVIFPASGIAVAAILYGGIRLLPGIWLGQFCFNLWLTGNTDTLHFQHVLVALLIAIGASLQAAIAWYLVKISGVKWKTLTLLREITLFLVLTAALASLVSATWANITLYLFGIISTDKIAENWFSWWIGDATGVLLLAPLTLTLLFRKQSLGRHRLHTVMLPTLLALTMIVLFFFYVASNEKRQINNQLHHTGDVLEHHIKTKLNGFTETVTSVSNLMSIYPDLSYTKFELFTRNLYAMHPDLHGLSWNPSISDSNRENFEAKMAKQLAMPAFEITQKNMQGTAVRAGNRDHYVPATYITPLNSNKQVQGYDIASDSVRFEAITKARQTGKVAITAPINLVQETASSAAILLISPINTMENHTQDNYTQDNGTQSNSTKNIEISGFAVAAVRIENMMKSLFSQG